MPKRAIGEIGHSGAEGRGCDDCRPIEVRMEPAGRDLKADQHHQRHHKQHGAGEIAPLQRHGDSIAAGLAQRGGGDLDDPEYERDLGNLAEDSSSLFAFHFLRGQLAVDDSFLRSASRNHLRCRDNRYGRRRFSRCGHGEAWECHAGPDLSRPIAKWPGKSILRMPMTSWRCSMKLVLPRRCAMTERH